jgi:hypothetical protein
VQTSGQGFLLYTPNTASEANVMNAANLGPTAGQRNSYVLDLDFGSEATRLAVAVYLNGSQVRSGDTAKGTPPIPDNTGGIVLGGYSNGAASETAKMGAGGSTSARLGRFLLLKMTQRDPRLAYAIMDYWFAGNYDLPPYMRAL